MDKFIKIMCVTIVGLFLIGAAIDTHETIPDNAIVWANDTFKKYYGDHTWKVMNEEWTQNKKKTFLDEAEEKVLREDTRKMTKKEAEALGYEVDNRSLSSGDFTGETCSLTYAFLQRIGVTPKKSRWNEDGSWKY